MREAEVEAGVVDEEQGLRLELGQLAEHAVKLAPEVADLPRQPPLRNDEKTRKAHMWIDPDGEPLR